VYNLSKEARRRPTPPTLPTEQPFLANHGSCHPQEENVNPKLLPRIGAALLSGAMVLAACAPNAAGGPGGPKQSIGDGEGAVAIVAWSGYIERGETDPAYDWVTDFEAETGCMVSVKV